MRWTLIARPDEARVRRTAKSCGPDAPTLASSRWNVNSADDSGKKARSLGRARRKPLKPLRRECRVMPVCTCGDYARVLFFICTRGCGRIACPAFPAPSDLRGQDVKAKLACDARRDRGGVGVPQAVITREGG